MKTKGYNIWCATCGCMPKPDEWACDVNCIDCGASYDGELDK